MKTKQKFLTSSPIKNSLVIFAILLTSFFGSCNDDDHLPRNDEHGPSSHAKKFSADVALVWTKLQQNLTKSTPGFDPLVQARSFSYSGLALYESIVKGMPGYVSVASPRIGTDINELADKHQIIHWPASANAAMASIIKNLFANTSPANKYKIDSVESVFYNQFQLQQIPASVLQASAEYGKNIAIQIFEWSKTDGGHEAYLSSANSNYIPPTGAGLWIPTPPANAQPARPFWGNNRSFVPNSASETLPPPPPSYAENESSEFCQAVNALYNKSFSLTTEEIAMVKTWGDIPGNYGTSSHYTNIATQLIAQNNLKLDEAAVVYAKHGMAIYEATISVFKAKYTYNLIRPISYIRNVLGHASWNTVIGTPAHPEYPSAHATIGGASFTILEGKFGKNCSFTDRTHENLWGARSYNSLKEYAVEAATSRFLGGIHYAFSAEVGLSQGIHVGELVNNIEFKGSPQ